MFKIEHITNDWQEAGAFMAQVNLYGFWDEHCFLTKSGDLGCALKIGGIDAEGLDHAGRDYVVKRLEAAPSYSGECHLKRPEPIECVLDRVASSGESVKVFVLSSTSEGNRDESANHH